MMLTVVLLATFCLLVLTFLYKTTFQHWKTFAGIPAVGYRWPIVGNLFDMTKTHLVLTDWAKRYGPIFRFSLHGEEIVVLNDFDTIYDALVTKGSDIAGRPHMKRTNYENRSQNSIVWQTYTPKLQFLRKQIHQSLRMYGGGLERLQNRCEEEIKELVSRIVAFDNKPFDSWHLFYDSACNIMLDLAIGIRLPYNGEEFARLKEINGLFNHTFGPGSSRVLDGIPWTNSRQSKEYMILQKALYLRNKFWEDYKTPADLKTSTGSQESVIDDLRKLSKQPKYSNYDISESTLKESFTNLILAGTDTTTTALTCFLLILLHYPDIQNKLHEELNHVIKSRRPEITDKASMPYMEACLLETLRFISHVPLAVPHATICDTSVCGKRIPKDTTVYINLWALHHDESFWKDPWAFNPDRFLTEDGVVVPPYHECRKRLMVFGAGRRVCLGEAIAKNRLFLFATSLLQTFKFIRDDTEPLPDIDPRQFSLGIVLHPVTFKVKALKREHCEQLHI